MHKNAIFDRLFRKRRKEIKLSVDDALEKAIAEWHNEYIKLVPEFLAEMRKQMRQEGIASSNEPYVLHMVFNQHCEWPVLTPKLRTSFYVMSRILAHEKNRELNKGPCGIVPGPQKSQYDAVLTNLAMWSFGHANFQMIHAFSKLLKKYGVKLHNSDPEVYSTEKHGERALLRAFNRAAEHDPSVFLSYDFDARLIQPFVIRRLLS